MKYFAGVDTHRDTHSIVIINELGEVLDRFTIPTSSAGYTEAIARSEKHPEIEWGLEGIGSYGRSFADALLRAGKTTYEVPGMISKRSRRRLRQRGKSDVQDAHAIAESVLRERATLPRHLEEDAEEATRLVYERRDRKVRERTEKINRIRALALRLALDLPKDLTSSSALDDLDAALTGQAIAGYA